MEKHARAIVLNPKDSVAVALTDLPAGTFVTVNVGGTMSEIRLEQAIEFGHKFAVRPIAKGETVLKYGEAIGRATSEIRPGEHVHVHNLEGIRGRGDRLVRGL